jgi:hypothetical protein
LLSFKGHKAFSSFLLMLGLEDLDFSNMGLILNLNSMPRVGGSFETTDSQHSTCNVHMWPTSESVRICFLEAELGTDKTLFCWSHSKENLQIWITFSLLNMFLKELCIHGSEDTLLVRIPQRCHEKIVQLLYSLGLGHFVMPMKMYPVPENCLTGTINNFEWTSTTDGSL